MPHQELSTFSKRFTILAGLLVVGAMSFGLAISFYRNLLFEETLATLSQQNRELRERIDDELDQLAYYRSYQYRSKYAKENLGKRNVDEKVLILTEETLPARLREKESLPIEEERHVAYWQYLQHIPIFEHWMLYLFQPEELKKLKTSF